MNATTSTGHVLVSLRNLTDEVVNMRPLLPTYLHLVASAVFPIYAAAHASLRRPSSAAPAGKKVKRYSNDQDDDHDESSSPIETLTTSDAILFPVLAGSTLTALYVIIKWLEDPAILNKILGYYFNWMGLFFTFKFIRDVLYLVRSMVFPSQFSLLGVLYKVRSDQEAFIDTEPSPSRATVQTSLSDTEVVNQSSVGPKSKNFKIYWRARRALNYRLAFVIKFHQPFSPESFKFNVTIVDLLAALISTLVALITLNMQKTPWYLTNLAGFSFCYGSLQFLSPGTSATGSLLLGLLFFYDIYMVFYTPMMVTVATKLDVPIKLLFPKPDDGSCLKPLIDLPGSEEMEKYLRCLAKKRSMAMLGLGDIVVPGIMIAFALRFDLYRYYSTLKSPSSPTVHADAVLQDREKTQSRPAYISARGMWVERLYTTRRLWSKSLQAKSFPKPYFKATLFGYVLGMVVTLLVMQVYQHAQPALLYLVPGVLTGFWVMALWKQEIRLAWNYDETEEVSEIRDGQEEKKKKDQKLKEHADERRDKAPGTNPNDVETDMNESQNTENSKQNDESSLKTLSVETEKQPIFSFQVFLPAS